MKKIKDALEDMKGKHVDIYTKHYLFDSQHIKSSNFIPVTDIGIGFKHKDQKIYIKNNEIETYDIKENMVVVNSKGFIIMVVKTA